MLTITSALNDMLSIDKIKNDARSVVSEADGVLWVNDEKSVDVSTKDPLEVIAKSFHIRDPEYGFGNHFRALVAVGGLIGINNGIPEAGKCFLTLWYNQDVELITVDVQAEAP